MKNIVLKTITSLVVIIGIVSACCLDTLETNVFHIICGICLAYLSLFVYANKDKLCHRQ